jgi:hypothetical protein
MNASPLSHLRRLFACLSVCLLAIGSASAASPIKLFITHGSATTSSDRLDRVDVDGTNVTSLAADTANFAQPDSLQIDENYEGGRIFMVDAFGGTRILKFNLDGTGRTLIHTISHGGIPRGMALDRANQHIYFTTQSATSSSDRITRINYDGTNEVTIASGTVTANDLVTNPLGLAIDTVRGFLYVGDNFNTVVSNLGVVRFNLNGTGRTPIIAANDPTFSGNVVVFQHMTVDESTGQLYVCTGSATTSNDRIMRVNSDGTGLTSLYSGAAAINQPVAIAIDKANGWLFVGDSAIAVAPAPVWRFNLDGSGGRIQLSTGYSNGSVVNGLAVFSNTPPTISDVTNQNIAVGGSTGNLAVTVGDGASETPAASLLLYAKSSNQTLVPDGNIVLGGSGASRTVNVTGAPGQSGTATITLTLNDGARTVRDTFAVTAAALSNNADLSTLVITTATYSPAFAAGTTTGYTASVPNGTSSVTVTPTRAQANATIEARSNANAFASVISGSPSGALNLTLGSNTLDVKVTAQDGITLKTYTITVTRRSLIEDWRLSFFADASGTSTRANGADFDLDGKTNLLEFAFGTDPTLGSSGPPALTMTGTYAAAVFGVTGQPITKLEPITNGVDYRAVFIRRVDHAAAGLTYTPEFSADNFTSFTASGTIPTVLATSGDFQLVSVPYPHFLSNGKKARFFRVSVSIAP